ncbi:septum formation initiator family protein [Arthrobacter sp. UYEF21]|uniref:FtsB family cell division protein n=1 Tax=Arthrobacter sp. UYEF21 TaxID=1756364 RepID=UPI003398D06A
MATRRPKVPKAASTRQATTDHPKEAADTAGVIRADFGGAKEGSARDGSAQRKATTHQGTLAKRAPAKGAGATNGSPAKASPASKVRAGGRSAAGGTRKGDDAQDGAQPVPAKAFSGRMLALAVVMIAITIMLAPTVKIFFDKRAELTALSDDIAARQAEGDRLRQQISRWQDPNYVKQQARDRINMVMPGETGYWVFGSDLPAGTSSSQNAAAAHDPADLPWVDSLWESVRRSATD